LAGHSLGGTLAAIYCALEPQSIRGLVLVSAPLCFAPGSSQFRDALVSLLPRELLADGPVPGSLLSQASALASPESFVWARLRDAVLSSPDPAAMDIHSRVERWALDEVPLPGPLVIDIIELLYREDRFRKGSLSIRDQYLGPSRLRVPILAIVNTADEVVPLASVKPFLDEVPGKEARIIEYPGEAGVGLQHLAVLSGRQARAQIWPQVFSWFNGLR
ncbi:MAG: alpha/beta hydrolase, partial [Beijerinckiaceae bacterium]|nr:alpha/beta hydrolase [Beijerinckiaceae bacterium]